MDNDQERQPLLGTTSITQTTNISARRGLRGLHGTKKGSTIITILILLLGTLLIGFFLLCRHIPENELIVEYARNVTKFEVENISFDGWEIIDQERLYKLKVKSSVRMDYSYGTGLPKGGADFVSYVGEHMIKELCFDMKSLETFEEINETDSVYLAMIRLPDTICISLLPDFERKLEFTVLVRPHTKRIIPILKKLWDGNYQDLNLWSKASITFRKQFFSHKIPIFILNIPRVNWKDLGIWEQFANYLRHLYSKITDALESIDINDLRVTDTTYGYNVESKIGIKGFLTEYNLPLDEHFPILPELIWHVSFPSCENGSILELRNINVSSPGMKWGTANSSYINLAIHSLIEGPLPDEFVNHVCASDDSNVVTPMSQLLTRLFDPEKLIYFQTSCIDTKNSIPNSALSDEFNILKGYLGSSVALNYTLDINDIIQEVGTKGIKLKWVSDGFGRRKLYIVGKIIANIKIPHYQISKLTNFFINRIKGNTELYHNGVHMLTIPLDYWTPCQTTTIIDQKSPDNSFFAVSFDIDDNQVIIRNTMELSQCINEILFKGESEVTVSGKLDLMLNSPIGDIVLLGIPGEGNTVIR